MHRFAPLQPASRRLSGAGLGLVLAAHAVAFWALLQQNLVAPVTPPSILTVSLLPPPSALPPEPPRPQPKPQAPAPKPQAAPQAPAVDAKTPTPAATPSATPAPVAAPTMPAAPAASTPTPPVAQSQPRYDADYLDNPKPAYPPLSRRLGEQGRVVLRVHVDTRGLPGEIQLHTSSGAERLDQAALATVRRWKFVPAKRGAEPIADWVLVPIAFSLKE